MMEHPPPLSPSKKEPEGGGNNNVLVGAQMGGRGCFLTAIVLDCLQDVGTVRIFGYIIP